ncbi:hypothetical protein ACJBU6_04369 [Exserohilum turcicum]
MPHALDAISSVDSTALEHALGLAFDVEFALGTSVFCVAGAGAGATIAVMGQRRRG